MNIRKRLLALVMTLVMAVAYMPAVVYAVEGTDKLVKVKSVEPLMVDHFRGEVGTDEIWVSGYGGFLVTYSDGTEVSYVYKEGTYKDADGQMSRYSGYYKDGKVSDEESDILYAFAYSDENYQLVLKKGWNKDVRMVLKVPCSYKDSNDKTTYYTEKVDIKINVRCDFRTPKKVSFKPADGFKVQGYVGNNYIDESYFYGEGNAFEVVYDSLSYHPEDDTYGTVEVPVSYSYVGPDEGEEGFYEYGDPENERFEFPLDTPEVYLKKGSNKVKITYTGYADGSDKPIKLPFTVNINARKLNAYANWPIFAYTGKSITKAAYAKKLVVKDSNDKVIPSSAYTFKWKKVKKMGWYQVKIRFKNKSKYVDSITAEFAIGPKTPRLTKVTGGKRSLTVTWKKFTKAQMKKIDGMYIEVARNKNFTKGYKIFTVSKKALKKSNKKTVRKLAGNKKYYVRISTYKKVKQNGEQYYINSNESKVKTCKTRK